MSSNSSTASRIRSGVISPIAFCSSRLLGVALANSGRPRKRLHLAFLEIRLGDDLAVYLDQHLLDDFRLERDARRQETGRREQPRRRHQSVSSSQFLRTQYVKQFFQPAENARFSPRIPLRLAGESLLWRTRLRPDRPLPAPSTSWFP